MDLNPDFFDMIAALQDEGAEFLVLGAFAMARKVPAELHFGADPPGGRAALC